MPQQTSVSLYETPEVTVPHQEETIPDRPTIEQPAIKDKQPDDTELKERIFYLMMEASSKILQKVVSYTELTDTAKKILGIEENTAIEAIKRLLNEGKCYEPRVGFFHPILNEEKPSPSLPASASEKQSEHESMTSTDALSIRGPKEQRKPEN